MWIEINKEEYMQIFSDYRHDLKPFASYTDIDGVLPFSSGKPQYMTEWGINYGGKDEPLLKAESEKQNASDSTFTHRYFKWANPIN